MRHNTQALLDAIAPGDTATWDRLLDSRAIEVDENDVVRDKVQILANLQPLGPGITGHLDVDDFRVATRGDMAVVAHEDNQDPPSIRLDRATLCSYAGRYSLTVDIVGTIGFVDRREGRDVAWKRIG